MRFAARIPGRPCDGAHGTRAWAYGAMNIFSNRPISPLIRWRLPTSEGALVVNGLGITAAVESSEENVAAVVGERLTVAAFGQLSGVLSGHAYVKLVVDRELMTVHFINSARYQFHAHYIAEELL